MKIKTAELIGPTLDWAVAQCEGYEYDTESGLLYSHEEPHFFKRYSSDWAQGGPLLERECLDVRVFAEHGAPDGGPYWISERHPAVGHGPTPLIAAMRCLVASRLGDEVDVPDELV